MKKSTGVLLGLGFFFIIGCALLAFVMYPSAKDDVTTEVSKSFSPNSSTLNLNVDSLAAINIYKTSSAKVKVSGTLIDLNNEKLKTSQEGDTINLTTSSTKMTAKKEFVTSTFNNLTDNNGRGHLTIGIPTTIDKLHITTKNAEIYNLSVEELSITQAKTSQNQTIYISGLKAGTVNFSGQVNNLNLSDSSVDKIIAKDLNGGDFSMSSNTFAKADFSGTGVNFSLGYNMGAIHFADVSSSNISLDNHTGDATIKAASTDVNLGDNIVGNLDVALTRSNISGYFNENPKSTYITANVTTGTLNLFGNKTFGKKTADYQWVLATTLGNIELRNAYDDDYDDTDVEDDETMNTVTVQESTSSSVEAATKTSSSVTTEQSSTVNSSN